jgi:hypothetical protein
LFHQFAAIQAPPESLRLLQERAVPYRV